ncbi:helix-turn-helix transcriptional regulator [Streptomyces sp. NPDC058045]|uniref:helix-turn-helix transcriptional regulator n=1 Tax=Streptomyces sp. NPDC058045 TaxID=3346311 RepID=UPI0036EBEC3A
MPAPPQPWILTARRAIGNRIRAVRLHRCLTQERLAELAGLDRQTINRIEQGHAAASIDNLLRIARALDVPLRDLV